jgi:protoporphyrinogen oxidase
MNTVYKYIILGAGPSGLCFANRLLEKGEESFLVLEKEKEAGGLCRSAEIDGKPLDIGGGHFLDVKNKRVLDFVFKFLPEKEWASFKRISTIKLKNIELDYPFESNIWQFPKEEQLRYLLSISQAGCNIGEKMPEKFIDWISWKLGDKIAKDYMIPYNEKIWSIDLNKLGTYWLYKLPNVSLEDTLRACLNKKPAGKMPAHGKFLYPKKFGYGEVWKRMAENIKDHLVTGTKVNEINLKNKIINKKYKASKIINTIPWQEFSKRSALPESIKKNISKLKFGSIRISYKPKNAKTKAHWTYMPDESILHHRELYRSNFCRGSRGYWTETNEKRFNSKKSKSSWSYLNKYAYPLNTIEKPEAIEKIMKYFEGHSIFSLGRWGEWEHMNSDVSVDRAISMADKFLSM